MSAIDETKRKIEIMQHFVDGGKVEFRYRGETVASNPWRDIYPEIWDWQSKKYRKKPEPITRYINIRKVFDQKYYATDRQLFNNTSAAIRAAKELGGPYVAIAVPVTFSPNTLTSLDIKNSE